MTFRQATRSPASRVSRYDCDSADVMVAAALLAELPEAFGEVEAACMTIFM
jgi:hypothetical protein